jgi:hypothetical protein
MIIFMSFFLLTSSDIADYTSSVDFKENTVNSTLQENYNISEVFVQTNTFNDHHELNSKSINVLEKIVSYIITLQVVHNSGDTIKRSLIAQVNNAILILKDDDSDNDKIICNNFVNKFISNIKLYERIGVFKPNSSTKILEDVIILKNSLCASNNINIIK